MIFSPCTFHSFQAAKCYRPTAYFLPNVVYMHVGVAKFTFEHSTDIQILHLTLNTSLIYNPELLHSHMEIFVDVSPLSFDNSGVDTYLKTCRKLKLSPIRQVCEGLMATKAIEVKNRGLNPSGALSITNALLVSTQVV